MAVDVVSDIGRKARGAFFTPRPLAAYMTRWAIRSGTDLVLEPSCGEAVFLEESGKRLKELSASGKVASDQLRGIEIDPKSALAANRALHLAGFSSRIDIADFFEVPVDRKFDAVVGNPPYVRYQQFSGNARARSQELALSLGVRISGLASSWAAFVIHAAEHLAPGGRLALVLPAELLSVGYAAQVRSYLMKRFGKLRLITFEQRVFPGVLEDVVVLLAEGAGGASFFELYQTRNVSSLVDVDAAHWVGHTPGEGSKWTAALVTQNALSAYTQHKASYFESLADWGRTYLGSVTGNNGYFTLRGSEARSLGLNESELLPISPPGSRHLRGLEFSKAAWREELKRDSRCFLFQPSDERADAAAKYIATGINLNVEKAYKCRVRSPWWRVPLVEVPDLLLTYMDHDRPRLVSNPAGLHILNSVYGVKLKKGRTQIGRQLLPIGCLNSLTLLGAEVVGRSYGGGMLKLEPREADRLPVPSFSLLKGKQEELMAIKPRIARALRQGDLAAAVVEVDKLVLAELAPSEVTELRTAREFLFGRRKARAQSA